MCRTCWVLHGPNQGVLWAALQDGLDGSFPSLARLCCTEESTSHPPRSGGSNFISTVTHHLPAYWLSDWFCTENSPAGFAASPRDAHQQVGVLQVSHAGLHHLPPAGSQHTNPEFAVQQQLLSLDISILLGAVKLMGMN